MTNAERRAAYMRRLGQYLIRRALRDAGKMPGPLGAAYACGIMTQYCMLRSMRGAAFRLWLVKHGYTVHLPPPTDHNGEIPI